MSKLIPVFVFLFLGCVSCTQYIVKDKEKQTSSIVDTDDPNYKPDHPGEAFFPSPDDDGTYIKVYFSGYEYSQFEQFAELPTDAFVIRPIAFFPIFKNKPARFLLYTSKNPTKPIVLHKDKDNSEAKGYFVPDGPVEIICHGWQSSYKKAFPNNIKNEFVTKTRNEKTNVILVDWEDLAGSIFYGGPAGNTREVGRDTAQLIEKLISEGFTDLKKIHFIGHSLGAHVGGTTASSLQSGKMARITGLDPAGMYFCPNQNRRLQSDDAEFVDSIHTSGGQYCENSVIDWAQIGLGLYGIGESVGQVGHVDFYPNGGERQPGCGVDESISCAHSRAHEFLTESVHSERGFPGCKCPSWEAYKNFTCKCETKVPMGERCPPSADQGLYFLRTAKEAPFANV